MASSFSSPSTALPLACLYPGPFAYGKPFLLINTLRLLSVQFSAPNTLANHAVADSQTISIHTQFSQPPPKQFFIRSAGTAATNARDDPFQIARTKLRVIPSLHQPIHGSSLGFGLQRIFRNVSSKEKPDKKSRGFSGAGQKSESQDAPRWIYLTSSDPLVKK